ncbi:MAG: hypothetical protein ACI89T_000666 [Cognaticolwellia sp.]|jgi:hypothetical protein
MAIIMVSRPLELPQQPLAERYVNLTIHTDPIRQTLLSFLLANEQINKNFALIFLPIISSLLFYGVLVA